MKILLGTASVPEIRMEINLCQNRLAEISRPYLWFWTNLSLRVCDKFEHTEITNTKIQTHSFVRSVTQGGSILVSHQDDLPSSKQLRMWHVPAGGILSSMVHFLSPSFTFSCSNDGRSQHHTQHLSWYQCQMGMVQNKQGTKSTWTLAK